MIQDYTYAPDYLQFYKYLLVLTDQQIVKLRNMAIGLSGTGSFSEEEIHVLEAKLMIREKS